MTYVTRLSYAGAQAHYVLAILSYSNYIGLVQELVQDTGVLGLGGCNYVPGTPRLLRPWRGFLS